MQKITAIARIFEFVAVTALLAGGFVFVVRLQNEGILGRLIGSLSPAVSAPPATAQGGLDDEALTKIALKVATEYGLQGSPRAQRSVRMTLGQWATLSKQGPGQLGLDTPVFALAIIGTVQYRGPGELPPGQTAWPVIDNIIVGLNALDGHRVGIVTSWSAATMFIQVPLNPTTPAPPLVFPPTSSPVAFPSPIPTATTLPARATAAPAATPQIISTPTAKVPAYP